MKMWCIKNYKGFLLPSSIAHTREKAIKHVLALGGCCYTWRELYRRGARAVRIKIVEVKMYGIGLIFLSAFWLFTAGGDWKGQIAR